jgi:hypothetical protein
VKAERPLSVRQNFLPMTLANMRANGVRAVIASCACGHKADVNVDALPETNVCPQGWPAPAVQRVRQQEDRHAAGMAHGAQRVGARARARENAKAGGRTPRLAARHAYAPGRWGEPRAV